MIDGNTHTSYFTPSPVLYKIDFLSQKLRKKQITMTSITQKNMSNDYTVLGNGKVSNVGLYKTGGNMVTEDWDANYVPDDWEDLEDDRAGYTDDEETNDDVDQGNTQAREARRKLLDNISEKTKQKQEEQQEQDALDCKEIKERLNWLEENKLKEKDTTLDHQEYPVLGASPPVKKEVAKPSFEIMQTKAVWTEVKGKKGKKTFQIGSGSAIAEKKKERYQQVAKTTEVRDKAFALLENKEELAKSLRKTTMCRSVGKTNQDGTPVKCPYGDRCNFAHSLDELQIRLCKFEDKCKFIYITPTGQIRNRKNCRACKAKHPGETDANYFARTGICKVAQPRTDSPKPIVLPKFSKAGAEKEKIRVAVETKEKMSKDKVASGGAGWSHMIKRTTIQSSPPPVSRSPSPMVHHPKKRKMSDGGSNTSSPAPESLPSQEVMKIPSEFMEKAIEIAMRMGKTNIRFECA